MTIHIVHIDNEAGEPMCGTEPAGAFVVDAEHKQRATCRLCLVLLQMAELHSEEMR